MSAITEVKDLSLREALQVALSTIIVRVSNQDGDTRYAAVSKQTSANLVYALFKRAARGIDDSHDSHFGTLFSSGTPEVQVLTRDVLEVEPTDIGQKIGLVITSPPYPNAYEYWLYHKYRMYWLGMDPLGVRAAEIGARPHYFKKNHQTEADFRHQMETVFRLLAAVTTPSALVSFIVGRSIIHGRHVDNAALLERAALVVGFRRLLTVERAIATTRKAFNPATSQIATETLIVFGR